ncbi:MAG: TIGR01906 family membrane protein [Dehalococcoidia bacterium]|nr:TIGR01906 family membrane protein [Dehalococcoidia bacterium]
MVILSRFAAACFVLALPVFLITSNVRFLASDTAFYRHGFREYHADRATGVPMADLDRAAGEIVDYFEDDSATLRIIVTADGQESSLFNTRETEHMKDVKSLIRVVYRSNEISLVVVLAYIAAVVLWARERSVRALAVLSLAGVGTGLAVVAVIGVFALTGFDAAWTRFHELVFSNDLWRLDPATDHLIQMFPEGFWQEATFIVGGLTLAEAAVIVIVSLGYLVVSRRPESDAPSPQRPARARAAPDTP